jgi:hypothetical protein
MRALICSIGSRDFLLVEKNEEFGQMIPIDRIREIDLRATNGASTNCVEIIVDIDDDMQNYYYNNAVADMLRELFIELGTVT